MAKVGTVQQVWELCVDDDQRHAVLAGQIAALLISKAFDDGRYHSDRVVLTWSTQRSRSSPSQSPSARSTAG